MAGKEKLVGKPGEARRPLKAACGSRARPGGPKEIISESRKPGEARRPQHLSWEAGRSPEAQIQHTCLAEEAWRGQEASKSFMGSRAMPGGPKGTRWYC